MKCRHCHIETQRWECGKCENTIVASCEDCHEEMRHEPLAPFERVDIEGMHSRSCEDGEHASDAQYNGDY